MQSSGGGVRLAPHCSAVQRLSVTASGDRNVKAWSVHDDLHSTDSLSAVTLGFWGAQMQGDVGDGRRGQQHSITGALDCDSLPSTPELVVAASVSTRIRMHVEQGGDCAPSYRRRYTEE